MRERIPQGPKAGERTHLPQIWKGLQMRAFFGCVRAGTIAFLRLRTTSSARTREGAVGRPTTKRKSSLAESADRPKRIVPPTWRHPLRRRTLHLDYRLRWENPWIVGIGVTEVGDILA